MGNSYSNANSYTVIECNHTPIINNYDYTINDYDIISSKSSTPSNSDKSQSEDNSIVNTQNIKKETVSYKYKRINHICEKLQFLHTPKNTNIPEDVYDLIKNNLKKDGINNENLKYKQIIKILKKNRKTQYYTQYYEYTHQIYYKITNKQPFVLSPQIQNAILDMFKKVSNIYHNCTPDNRTNFLNYNYIIHKLFKIIGLDDVAEFFILIKSKEKLKENDEIWKKICEHNKWKFDPSD
jgi:hypothetical protein